MIIFQIVVGLSSCAHLEVIVFVITKLYNKAFLGGGRFICQQTFFVRCQIVGILGFSGHTLLLQLLSSSVVAQKQPWTTCKHMSVTMFQ